MLTLSNSADVKRPQTPRDILFLFLQGLIKIHKEVKSNPLIDSKASVNKSAKITDFSSQNYYLVRYWHIGKRRNANATVAMTAVQIANSICIESKKKNMTSKDIEAPNGRHIACMESRVCIPLAFAFFSPEPSDSPSSLDSSSPPRNQEIFI